MAISDAGKLGSAISKHEGNLEAALQEYQQQRIPQTAKEVTSPPAEAAHLLKPVSFLSDISSHIPHPSFSPHHPHTPP